MFNDVVKYLLKGKIEYSHVIPAIIFLKVHFLHLTASAIIKICFENCMFLLN